ncbi:putative uncharacterized protein [Firmicutes bacterium CAG:882]|nr:putative uncharacterized protein [Firmicutes bacterium CAG:882]
MDNVVYGLINYGNQEISENAKGALKYIKSDIADIKRRYIALGFHLEEFDRYYYYKEFGFSSLADFVQANFGIEHSGLSRILSVYNRFCSRNGADGTIFVDDRFQAYSYSQLVEMVKLSNAQIDKDIQPTMTVKDIRNYVKNKKKCDVAQNKKVEEKVLTKQEKCASAPPLLEPDLQRPFDERYQLITGDDLMVEIMNCLKNNIKNVDKASAIIKLLNDCGL